MIEKLIHNPLSDGLNVIEKINEIINWINSKSVVRTDGGEGSSPTTHKEPFYVRKKK